MYHKDKIVKVSLRISSDQYNFLQVLCDSYGVSVSEAIRIILDSYRAYRAGVRNEDE